VFLSLKTTGEVKERARHLANPLAWTTLVLTVGFLTWTAVTSGSGQVVPGIVPILVLVLLGIVPWLMRHDQTGWAFIATGVTIALTVVNIFTTLYPNVMPSNLDPANSLTVFNASASPLTLKVMTIVAIIFTPIVLAYQGWTFWVFRKRVGREDFVQAG